MNKKLGVLVLVAVYAFSSMGMSFADDNYIEFTQTSSSDSDGAGGDGGDVSAYIDNAGNLIISVSNAYPCYEAYVTFKIQHVGVEGDPTMYLKFINITNDYSDAMDIIVTHPNGNPIPINYPLNPYIPNQPEESLDGIITIKMKDGAEQDKSYSFTVHFDFSDEL